MPQVHVLFSFLMIDYDLIAGSNEVLFFITLSSSVFTATLGISKFLKMGPCRLVPDEGLIGGYLNMGFLILMINTASTMMAKGLLLAAIATNDPDGHIFAPTGEITTPLLINKEAIGLWVASIYLPHLIYVIVSKKMILHRQWNIIESISFQAMIILISTIGMKKFLNIVVTYPAMILTPVFSIWTFGPSKCHNEKRLGVSFKLAWINLALTTLGILTIYLIHSIKEPAMDERPNANFRYYLISCSALIFSLVTLVILQTLPKCKNLFCHCCQINCYPTLKKTVICPKFSLELPQEAEVMDLESFVGANSISNRQSII